MAEDRTASGDRGGRPCLLGSSMSEAEACWYREKRYYLTRSAKVTGLLGRAASLLISSSAIWTEGGGCDRGGAV